MTKKVTKPKTHMISGRSGNMKIDGLPVVDAKKPLILEVTSDDIAHSNPKDKAGCAAAVAAMRQEGVTKALVHLSKVYIKRNNHYERYEAPKKLRTEVVAFDRGGTFEPDEFQLNAPYLRQENAARKAYRLQVPGGTNALPKKSHWKTYKTKGVAGNKPRKHIVANVRNRPSYSK